MLNEWPTHLQVQRASFVTLHIGERLRGCIGNLRASRSLVEDIARNAYGAAFEDPRFAPLNTTEFDMINVHLSVLSPPEPLRFGSAAELLAQIRPGIDGLILTDGDKRGTFLPAVWRNIPECEVFLRELKRKAGLPEDYWSDSLEIARYTAESW